MLTDIYAKASIYQTLYEIDKKRKKYEQAILYNDTALVYYDSIQKMVHHTEINSLIKKHSTEMYEQRVESRKHSVNHVFFPQTSVINFTSKKQSYDDTRRSSRDNELLQRAQSDL